MGKSKNEVNGVLVYRRWCAGAILSALILLVIIAVPVAAIVYNWLIVTVPDSSSFATAGEYRIAGLDLLRPILKKEFEFQTLINEIAGNTTVRFFGLIMTYSMYGMLGFIGLIAIFGVVEAFFFLFYLFTGRVVAPSAPVKISWVIFVLTLVYAGLSYGLGMFVANAYAVAEGEKLNVLAYTLSGLLGKGDGFIVNFIWPVIYTGVALVGAILLSIVYAAAFKDKFFIGRAKRFGSGEMGGQPTYAPATQIFTTTGTTTTTNPTGQPQVIVVNSQPAAAGPAAPIIASFPGGGQPVQVVAQQPIQQAPVGEPTAVPSATLPQDIKSIGGHAFSKNLDLKYADVPDGIKELGVGAFANCLNLEIVSLPKSIKRIKKNCFFNCVKLVRINYAGTKAEWRYVARGSNWLEKAGTKTVICSDGAIIVDPHR